MARKTADKFYDIAKATPVVTVKKTFGKKFGDSPDDDWTETLYRKQTGEYFVYGEGGKNTPYSIGEDGESVAGSRYETWVDFNYNQARNWVYTNCPEKMDEVFMAETKDKKVTSIVLSAKAKTNLKRKAQEQGTTISELIRNWAEGLYK